MAGRINAYPGRSALRGALTAVGFFGDSFAEGETNGDAQSARFPTQTCGLLSSAVGHTVTESNFAVGGTRNYANSNGSYIGSRALDNSRPPAAAPYGPVWRCAVLQASINNLNQTAVHADPTIVSRNVATSIHRLRSGVCYDITRDSAKYGYAGSMTGDRATGAAVWTLTTPSDFPGGVPRAYGAKFTGWGGTETFTVDGGAAGAITNQDAAVPATYSELWDCAMPTVAPGAHTIVGTISGVAGSGEFMGGVDFEYGVPPLIVVCLMARAPGYPGGTYGITDADVVIANAAVTARLAASFPSDPNIVVVDFDAVLGKSHFGADSIHPDPTGAGLLAAAIAAAITAHY